MKKSVILSAALMMGVMSAQAGGLLTNTNQNAAFLRNFAQEGQITLTSLYANPAGNAFLSKGWHLSLNSQTAIQQRNINTTFPLFAYNQENPGVSTHEFKGEAFAPIIPSFTVSHNWEKWSLSAHFGLIGGGGKCEFDKGLGSFEALYAGKIYSGVVTGIATNYANQAALQYGAKYGEQYLPQAIPTYMAGGMTYDQAYGQAMQDVQNAAVAYATSPEVLAAAKQYGLDHVNEYYKGYDLNAYMKGRSYYFGLQLGGAYKINDNLSAYIGVRGVFASCNYNGYVQDVQYTAMGQTVNATQVIVTPDGQEKEVNADLSLNCDQSGIGFTPIFGLDWMINDKWNVAIKYEAPTRMTLKNKTEMNDYTTYLATPILHDGTENANYQATLGQFADGSKVREDIPAILAAGTEFKATDKLRIDASAKVYFDKSARKEGNKEDLVDHNTWEVALGAEYDVCKLITVSGSWQSTNYGLSDKYMNDLSFNLSSNSLGLGVRIHASKYFNIDLGYMHTMYGDRTVTTATAAGDKVDVYSRKNDVIGVGVNIAL